MKKTRRPSTAGFTIMEVLMVSMLLFYLAYITFTAVRDLLDAKGRIDYRTDLGQVSRSLWSVMDRDLRNTFYITAEDLGWNPTLTEEEKRNNTPLPVKPIPQTLFQGTENQLLFSTRSHQRMSQDVPENEQHFVRYILERGKLIREESARAISRDDISNSKAFNKFDLLEDVTSLEFEYYNLEKERWDDAWDTNKAETLDRLPGAIKFKVVFTPKVEDDPSAKPVPVTVESTVVVTQRLFKEGPFAAATQRAQQNPPPNQ
jgi:type II secretory pathway component PulJ